MKVLYVTFLYGVFSLSVDFRIEKSLVRKYSNVELFCDYNSSNLTTVKYYKDDQEFFRYTPSANYPVQLFLVPDVTVSLKESNNTKVKLVNVSYESAGVYKCKVTEVAPSLQTAEKKHKLYVEARPYDFPELFTDQESYQPGDTLNATCVTGPTYPVPKLWIEINSNKIPTVDKVIDHRRELKLIISSLIIELNSSHFMNDTLYLTCIADRGIFRKRTYIVFEKNSYRKLRTTDY